MAKVPKHWQRTSWEEKARENPLFAVMTTEEMSKAGPDDFSPEHLESFFAAGRRFADFIVMPALEIAGPGGLVVEYGCGMGRILNALVERKIECSGIDISPTMLGHCRRLVPGVRSLHQVGGDGSVDLPDQCARVVYSYAVLQHISRLSVYERALDEMCRLVKPDGVLAIQVNCEDFALQVDGQLGRTENHETVSYHYAPNSTAPVEHKYTDWSGVYIGYERLKRRIESRGFAVLGVRPMSEKKPRAVLVTARHHGALSGADDVEGEPPRHAG
jgi:SAM-dependent methyltransferase